MPGRAGYYSRWVELVTTDVPCVFTTGVAPGTRIPMPMAHGEGRFTSADPEVRDGLESGRSVPFQYADAGGRASGFPANPNGALGAAAGVLGGRGNVLALMPHPERSAWLWQVPLSLAGGWGERRRAWSTDQGEMSAAGPGRIPFEALARYLREG
jgi:phosphoribosylformylglycinamidine (FGAM) synthase-like amidotransferase family enzyme